MVMVFGCIYSILLFTFSIQFKIYHVSRHTSLRQAIEKDLMLFLFNLAFTSIITLLGWIDLTIALKFSLIGALATVLWSIVFFSTLSWYRTRGYNYRDYMVVGTGMIAEELIQHFNSTNRLGFKFQGQIDPNTIDLNVVSTYFADNLSKKQLDHIYIIDAQVSDTLLQQIIVYCMQNEVRAKIVTKLSTTDADFVLPNNYNVVSPLPSPLDQTFNTIYKRLLDISISSIVVLTLLWWLLPILAILIKLDSKGPIFFVQKRTGENGLDFNCLKLRTMYVNDDANKKQAIAGDSRITRVGAFLRDKHLDELPQFINVLMGQMSIVGPRPHMLAHTKEFAEKIDKYMYRHFVKPGITGLSQVKGFKGEIINHTSLLGRFKLDLFYLRRWSFGLDLWIVYQTAMEIIKGEKE